MEISLASPRDCARMLEIYSQYIDAPVTFEETLPDLSEFVGRLAQVSEFYPWLVCREGGRVQGYAYAHRQQPRAAYCWNAELSVYLDSGSTSRGLGRRLYGALIELLAAQGIKTAYGLVTVPNERSERLHESMGFRRLGECRSTGYKCGGWRDVCWFEKAIGDYGRDPQPPRPLSELPASLVSDILGRYGGEGQ